MSPTLPALSRWGPLVELALAEDTGPGDVTSELTISPTSRGRAVLEAREPLVVCGVHVAREVFLRIDPAVDFEQSASDGSTLEPGAPIAFATGSLRSILVAERTALNFLSRMCGVASHTRRFVEAVAGTRTAIVDTRKTMPGWRVLDKYAAAVGGAVNHRFGLFDGILVKDNHVQAAGGIEPAVKAARTHAPVHLRVQIEVQSQDEAGHAVAAGADFLLIDNCTPEVVEGIVARFGDRAILEASGGIDLDNVRRYAETGVHRVSIGALTHSAPGADVALEIDPGAVGR